MKKMFLLMVLLGLTVFGSAQKVNGIPLAEIDAEYVEMTAVKLPFKSEIVINLDFGQKVNMFSFDKKDYPTLRDNNDKLVKFNSIVDVLNFLSGYGYEFVNAFAVTEGSSNVYHYLLRKNKKPVE